MAYTFKHGDRPLENFTIQRAIGRGGFGEVYYAVSDGGREVALKYLKENPHVELRGVSNCINLKSPYLVSIFDVKKNADGEYFIVMEYCSGPSLRDLLIAEPKGFAPEKAAFFCREIAKGLSYLHDRGIVHRDLKPGNIFFDDGYVKIGDYGLSKFIAVSRHSAQTASVGTVHYMAPEIGSGDYSKGVDIYALGVMLYEMLLGKVPFEGSSMAEVLMKHLTTQPELDELSPQFGKVIRKALQKDPKDRYQAVEEMIDDLLVGEDIQKSLAGFSAKSLEGAVRAGGRDRFDSPVPSPNPVRPRPEFPRTPGRVSGLGEEGPLPPKLARKMEALSRKIEKRVAKLEKNPRLPGQPPPLPARLRDDYEARGASPFSVPRQRNRGQMFILMLILTCALSTALGLLVGVSTNNEEKGIGAGLLVGALYLGLLLGRRVLRWIDLHDGPAWAGRMIRTTAAAPFIALGCIPIFEGRVGGGGALLIGLLAFVLLNNWEKEEELGADGEIKIGSLVGNAFFALILTAIAGAMTDTDPDKVMFIAAGVAAATSFLFQAGSWWTFRHAPVADGGPVGLDVDAGDERPTEVPLEKTRREGPDWMGSFAESKPGDALEVEAARSEAALPTLLTDALGRRPRAMLIRVFYSLVAFGLMGGAIVTFLYPIVARAPHHAITTSIIMCTGFSALALFALRKTTPLRQPGFWRETLRPFLISLSLFGIGATTTAIAREWNHTFSYDEMETRTILRERVEAFRDQMRSRNWGLIVGVPAPPIPPSIPGAHVEHRVWSGEDKSIPPVHGVDHVVEVNVPPPSDPDFAMRIEASECWPCLDDEGKTAIVAGLVMSSVAFVGLTFFTGRSPRRPIHTQNMAGK